MSYLHEVQERKASTKEKPLSRTLPSPTVALKDRSDEYLRKRGLDPLLAMLNVWYPSETIDGHPRLVIPASSRIPGHLFWQARLIDDAIQAPRYESPSGVRRADAVVTVWPAQGLVRQAAVVEGPMDALAAAEAGVMGIALMGATPSNEVIEHLNWLLTGRIVYAVMDRDMPGAMAAVQAKITRAELVVLLDPSPHKDLAEMPASQRFTFLRRS